MGRLSQEVSLLGLQGEEATAHITRNLRRAMAEVEAGARIEAMLEFMRTRARAGEAVTRPELSAEIEEALQGPPAERTIAEMSDDELNDLASRKREQFQAARQEHQELSKLLSPVPGRPLAESIGRGTAEQRARAKELSNDIIRLNRELSEIGRERESRITRRSPTGGIM
jgi:hypothetical protein